MVHRFGDTAFAADRKAMIREIEKQVRSIGTGDGGIEIHPAILDVMGQVPREDFVPETERPHAYANRPLPIGNGQTISQPLIVALMTHHLRLEIHHRVLEVGTGSGYQTAILAELVSDVTTVETVVSLADAARENLDRLGYQGIRFLQGDGRDGSSENAPFDRIIVTAAAEALPKALLDQLAPGGRLVAPIGPRGRQEMILVKKSPDGMIATTVLFPCAFVPLT